MTAAELTAGRTVTVGQRRLTSGIPGDEYRGELSVAMCS